MQRSVSVPGFSLLPQTTSVRSINRARIISLVRRNPGLMRAELSQLTGLSKATVSTLTDELLREGFLCEDSAQGTRQRKKGLHLNGDAGIAIGFEVLPGELRGMVTDASMRVLRRTVTPIQSHTVSSVLSALTKVHSELVGDLSCRCLGMVAVVPGAVDSSGQLLIKSVPLGWADVPFANLLRQTFGCSTGLINLSCAAVLGEYWHGAAIGVEDVIGVSISSGVGAGILVGGQLLGGMGRSGSELGHMTILPDGPQCGCGNRGCLESIASLPAIIEKVEQRIRRECDGVSGRWSGREALTYHDVIRAAQDGDPIVLEVIQEAAEYIGIAVANAVNLFSPRMVVISGQLAEAGEIAVGTIRVTAQRRAEPTCIQGVEITGGRLGGDAACMGACALVIDRYVAETEPAVYMRLSFAEGGTYAGSGRGSASG